ncbi:MAG: ATP-binding protein [Desulfobacterales bacterium CG07_land_8_20_14_0_80_52_14]|nr:MAG: ATP-binding protein [Desulfobacterales bacterium CG23_combo_of_CG06-09_8_20_14_all_52_9]PIU50701.1 MAG: ATP-binding protein [Desulfobacterales bacterium CG07_land_8_20_14_0_80_52_14]
MEQVPEEDKRRQQQQQQETNLKAALTSIKNKFIVMSGKGGVGKTSVSVNLAVALSKKNFEVGLIDVDLHGPDVLRMLGLRGLLGVGSNQKLIPMSYNKHLRTISVESFIQNRDNAIIWRGPLKHQAIQQFISEVDWGHLDFLIIDSPPGTGDEPLTVAQIVPGAKAIIVTTPQEIALADVRKSINFCRTVKMEIFGIVENMSSFKCPHCGKPISLFGSGGGEKVACDMGLTFLGKIPFDPGMVTCGDSGTCYQEHHDDSEVFKAFAAIADKMAAMV